METLVPPRTGKHKAEGQEPPAPTSLAGRELEDAICNICQEYLTDPVTIECGHNFCRGCISQRCERVDTAACPQCGETFQKRAFRSNTQLGSIIQFIKQVGLKPGQRGREGNVCEEHGKEFTWFCKKDSKAVCEDCKGSSAHRSHAVIPMAKAAHKFKEEASTSSRSENVNIQEQEAISTQQQELRTMASAHSLRKLLEEVVCPICLSYFKDAVSIDCGHNFCQVCITAHYEQWKMETEEVFCPQCRKNIKKENFQTNWQLASVVQNIQG